MAEREPTPFETFHSYMRGWYAGAGHKGKDPRYHNHPTLEGVYNEGYEAGKQAGIQAGAEAAKRLGYTPSILRIEGTDAADRIQTRLPIFTNEDGEFYTPAAPGRRGGRGRE